MEQNLVAFESGPNQSLLVIAPTVHLNGTSRGALVDAYEAAFMALGEAIRAVHETYPNARDYYVQGPDATARAMREHKDRLDRLEAVKAELVALFTAVEEA